MTIKATRKIKPCWNNWLFNTETPVPEKMLRRFQKPQDEFDIAFLEDILVSNRNHLDTMRQLAELYTRNGQYRHGLDVDRRIVAACPTDAVAHYNLACSLSLTNRIDECFQMLTRALRLGYFDYEHMALDSDLEGARKDARWTKLFSASMV
jgi:hypothetical protein